MEDNLKNTEQNSEEIGLGEVYELFQRGSQSLFTGFLKIFVYLKKNTVKLSILIVAGLAVGFGLKQIVNKEYKTEVIIKPNLDSKTYLYDVVSEIKANLKSKDTAFFTGLDIDAADLEGFKIEIASFEKEEVDDLSDEVKYLELLEKFRNEEGILDIIRSEIMDKSIINHRIIFTYKNTRRGRDVAVKMMNYINSNEYYNELVRIHVQNAETRIKNNQALVAQIDELIDGYTMNLGERERTEGTLVLSEEDQLDIPGLLRLKNGLIKDTETKRIEIQQNKDAIRIISFGSTQEVIKPLFSKFIFWIPAMLVVFYLLWDLSKYLNRKATELQLQ